MATPIPEEVTSSYAEQPDGTRITETKHPDGTSTIVRETLRIDDGGEYQPLAPTGKFRNGMCDCCEVFCSGRFWVKQQSVYYLCYSFLAQLLTLCFL